MKRFIAFFIFFVNGLLFCINPRQTNEFYIELPDNWIQIPNQAVEFLMKEVNRPAALDPYFDNYNYLYQLKSNDTLFTLPYLLIQINNNKRLSKSELTKTNHMQRDNLTGYLWSVKDSTINVIIPTEKGTINIYAISSLSNSGENKILFHKMIKSIIVAHDLAYKDDFIHNTPIIRDLFKKENSSNILVLAIVIAAIAARIYKKKTSPK